MISATLIVLVIRTRNSFYKSRPGNYLLIATLVVVAFVAVLPMMPFAGALGLVAVPPVFYLAMLVIVLAYLLCTEVVKKFFFRRL